MWQILPLLEAFPIFLVDYMQLIVICAAVKELVEDLFILMQATKEFKGCQQHVSYF